jgi:hypothetical protein
MPWLVSTNCTLRCKKLFCLTGISMLIGNELPRVISHLYDFSPTRVCPSFVRSFVGLKWLTDLRVGYAFWNYHLNRCYFCNATDSRDTSTRTLTQSDTLILSDFTIWWRVTTNIYCISYLYECGIREPPDLIDRYISEVRDDRAFLRTSHKTTKQTLFLNIFMIYMNSCKFM